MTKYWIKDPQNEQFGRVSINGGDAVPADVDFSSALPNYGHEPLVDPWGRIWTNVSSIAGNFSVTSNLYQTTVLGTSGDIKTTPGVLFQVWGFNSDPTNLAFFQLFNETGPPPVAATVPLISIPVQPNYGVFSLSINQPDYGVVGFPLPFSVGIEWAVSTTPAIFTAAATPFWVNAIYA